MKIIGSQSDYKMEITQGDLEEIEIMNQIDNPYLNKLIDYYFQFDQEIQSEQLVLLQPLAMSDLKQFLKANYAFGRMPEKQAIEFLAQLAIGLKALHDKSVNHRDLNPNNILVFRNESKTSLDSSEFILKIADFGCSKIFNGVEEDNCNIGRYNYMSPEQKIKECRGYNPKIDVYALGLTVFEMITGQILSSEEIIQRKAHHVQYYSTGLIDLLYKLCSQDIWRRPSINDVVENPIVQNSQAYQNCLLKGTLTMTKSKIETTIAYLKNFQKHYGRDYIKEGYFRDGINQGEGCEYGTNSNGQCWYYDGKYVDGKSNGYGVMFWSYGGMYFGMHKNGCYHGKGIYYWNDGRIYKGQWMNDLRHGEGIQKYSTGETDQGSWYEGKLNGEILRTLKNGQTEVILYDKGTLLKRKEEQR
eukprot:403352306